MFPSQTSQRSDNGVRHVYENRTERTNLLEGNGNQGFQTEAQRNEWKPRPTELKRSLRNKVLRTGGERNKRRERGNEGGKGNEEKVGRAAADGEGELPTKGSGKRSRGAVMSEAECRFSCTATTWQEMVTALMELFSCSPILTLKGSTGTMTEGFGFYIKPQNICI